jgi:hypothetical protein
MSVESKGYVQEISPARADFNQLYGRVKGLPSPLRAAIYSRLSLKI